MKVSFFYNNLGRGVLHIVDSNGDEHGTSARCGSINKEGLLVNYTPCWNNFYLVNPSVPTDEPAMVITPGKGRKIALYTRNIAGNPYSRTHYLIHPDGGKGGSEGCIVFSHDGEKIFLILDNMVKNGPIKVEIGRI